MARIRSIKPEFPQSETIGSLSRDSRLLFILLWTIVDDAGRARAASRMLASLLFPYDDDAPAMIDTWLAELEREGCVRRYVVEGSTYLDIPNWLKHQKIDKPSGSKLPPFNDHSTTPREASRIVAPDLGPRTLDLGEDHKEIVGSDEPTLSVLPKEKFKKAPKYDPAFDILWDTFPKHPNASKSEAYLAWSRLSPDDRDACLDGAMGYDMWLSAERAKRPDFPGLHLVNFIKQRRFEGHLDHATWRHGIEHSSHPN